MASDPTETIPDYEIQPISFPKGGMSIETGNKDNYVGGVGFQDMGLRKELLMALNECGFEHPSEVQSQVIPKAILKQDIICQAKSGMGKTAVFVISILNQEFSKTNDVNVICICHTRELADQVKKEFDRMKKHFSPEKFRTAVFVGGTLERDDIDVINTEKPNIVIGTPGRLHSLVHRGALGLGSVEKFVIDECDKVLSSNERNKVTEIFIKTPKTKQVMMFSATLSDQNRERCRQYVKNAHEVFIDDGEKLFLHDLHLYYENLKDSEKHKKLMEILDDIDFNQCIVFLDNMERCKMMAKKLMKEDISCGILYGKMEQLSRNKEFNQFRKGETRILITTDLCGRGIDVEKVNLVVNYDMPKDSDQFLHRVGRAGRFGTKGLAISFIENADDKQVFEEVQSRFSVQMQLLPNIKDIPTNYYK